MRMQRRPCTRYDVEAFASAASLFSSSPLSPLHPFPGFFQYRTRMTIAESGSAGCLDFTNTSASYGVGVECNYGVERGGGDYNAKGGDYSDGGGEREGLGGTIDLGNGIFLSGEGPDGGHLAAHVGSRGR
jgi:hypothetical protein